MRTAKQFSVTSVNKPGRLAAVLEAMRKEKVELLALAAMDSMGRHTLRFVPDDPALATSALDTINVPYESSDVLLVDLPSQSGAYPHMCERLAAGHLELDYCYGSTRTGNGKGGGMAVVKVNDLAKAQRLLSETGTNGSKKKLPRRRPIRPANSPPA